jgi:hypothetical protein
MNHISTLDLHRLRYGELDRARTTELRSHMDGCPSCLARLQAQQAMRAEFEVLPVPEALKGRKRSQGVPSWVWALLPGVTVAALALFVLVPTVPDLDGGGEDGPLVEDVRYKSAGKVEVILEGAGVVDPKAQTFHTGDRIQVRVAPGPWKHAWIADGSAVTGAAGGAEILGTFEVEAGKATLAPFSLVVDGEPGPVRLVVVMARTPLKSDEIQRILGGEQMAGVSTASVELRKQ